ncbi:transmembrane and coiled-coil domains protein 1-like [Archocentrus centrarchus]|uniref:transmembrane and coiled-coil domains protein 1-like n=1 Tax=Archocentrus centrarchus TaxID=63155 RepID=UPI0011E9C3AF|nr:transmembrane and coiled-coil domains protein 1-like [Archocentrus centrarchus]
MDESQGEEGTDPQGIMTPGTEQLQSNLDYGSNDESPSAAGGTSEGSTGSRDCTPDHTKASAFDGVLSYIHELQESQRQLEESFESLRDSYQQDYSLILEALQEEQSRCDYLEQRLTDVTELIQKEVWNMEKELATKEKFADQPYDTQDFTEVLQACETRLFKLEQQQQQEQTMQPERWTNTTHLLGKLINVPLAIMAVLLVLVSKVASCVVLFVKTSRRILCTLLFLILLSFLWRHQEVILDHLFLFLHSASWK